MPASFSDLATETAEQILNILDSPDELPDPGTLARLNRTSKGLNALTTWRLYRAPRYRYSDWPLLARTLMARRDLASLVKDLHFDGNVFDDPLVPEKFPEEVATYYLKNMDPEKHLPLKSDDPDEATLFTASEDDDAEVYIEMDFILNLCRNVEKLFVNLMLCYEAFNLLDPPPSLPRLASVSFGYSNAHYGFAIDHDLSRSILSAAPNLTRLSICRVKDCWGFDFALENVTELVIGYSALSGAALKELLSLVPNLQRLEYEGGGTSLGDAAEQFTPSQAMEAISENCRNLKYFCFDLTYDDIDRDWVERTEVEKATEWFASRGIEFKMPYWG